MHELNDHWHEHDSPDDLQAEFLRSLEVINLTTVGIDIGSSTSHLMISEVELQRLSHRLSSRFVVVSRQIRFSSDIMLTPFRSDGLIDAEILSSFISECYAKAGVERSEIDTGAVILTGEALKRDNAHAIVDLFAAEGGRFVCASAGHLLEAQMAASGSGVLSLSSNPRRTILNIDIGGGTTKFAIVRDGLILESAAIAVGGRLLAWDEGRVLTRIEEEGRLVAADLGIQVELGRTIEVEEIDAIARRLAEVLIDTLFHRGSGALSEALWLTPPLSGGEAIEALSFSGGVAEYIYNRENAHFGDLAPLFSEAILALLAKESSQEILEPRQGIRATVIGASQFSFQVSGNTVRITNCAALPFHNLPVVRPRIDFSEVIDPILVSSALANAVELQGDTSTRVRAIGLSWHGTPNFVRIAALAQGLLNYLNDEKSVEGIVVLLDADIGRALGHILVEELGYTGDVVCLDGIEVGEFDYVDIGAMLEPSNVVPVVIKSLLF